MTPTLTGDFEGFRTSVEGVTADVVETAKKLELEVKPEDVVELLQARDKTWTDEELLLMDEPRKWFLEIESPCKDAVKIDEITAKDLKYYISLVNKTAAGLEWVNSSFEASSTVGKMLSNSIACYREMVHERKSQSMQQTSLWSYFKIFPQPPTLQPSPP